MVMKISLANDGSNYSDWYLKALHRVVIKRIFCIHGMTKDQLLKIRVNPTDTKKEDQRKWKEQERIVQALILAIFGDQLQRKFINNSS